MICQNEWKDVRDVFKYDPSGGENTHAAPLARIYFVNPLVDERV